VIPRGVTSRESEFRHWENRRASLIIIITSKLIRSWLRSINALNSCLIYLCQGPSSGEPESGVAVWLPADSRLPASRKFSLSLSLSLSFRGSATRIFRDEKRIVKWAWRVCPRHSHRGFSLPVNDSSVKRSSDPSIVPLLSPPSARPSHPRFHPASQQRWKRKSRKSVRPGTRYRVVTHRPAKMAAVVADFEVSRFAKTSIYMKRAS